MCASALASLLLTLSAAPPDLARNSREDLWTAAKTGDVVAVKSLLARGVDVNARTPYGATALHFAADKGHLAVVRLLLEHKANVNARDTFYKAAPLDWAFMRNRLDVIRALAAAGSAGAGATLRSAASSNNVPVVRALLDGGKLEPAALAQALAATPADKTAIIDLLRKAGARGEPAKVSATPKVPVAAPVAVLPEEEGPGTVKVPANWPSFRGDHAGGVADGQRPPLVWDGKKGTNLRWKTPIPGLGHSCPVVWGDRVFLTTAVSSATRVELRPGYYGDVDSVNDRSEHVWKVYCLEKRSGKVLWERTATRGKPAIKRHLKGSQANPTPTTDGKHLVAFFASEGLFCYDLDGKILWKSDLGVLASGWFYDKDYEWGFASSPVIHKDRVIVQCDIGKGSSLAAFRLADGKQLWRTPRDEVPSWGTPTIVEGPGRVEVVTNATKFARGYDPDTGKELWRIGPNSEITVPTPIYAHGLIFVASGYRPVQPIYAIRPGAKGDLTLGALRSSSGSVAWSVTKSGPYMPTPIVYGPHLYVCSTTGIVTCFEAKTGKEVYKARLGRGTYTASPVAADGRLYFTSEEDGVRVVKAGPKFKLLAVNPIGEVCMATPALADGMIFVRSQHHLWAFGRQEARPGRR